MKYSTKRIGVFAIISAFLVTGCASHMGRGPQSSIDLEKGNHETIGTAKGSASSIKAFGLGTSGDLNNKARQDLLTEANVIGQK